MCARMSCRGPDGEGVWRGEENRILLGHRRLSIIDLSERGSQPMVDEMRHLAITFNGEIYNFRELRCQLEQKGYAFSTESDTEVLLLLYAEYGREMVRHLRGMFAFALWDGTKGGLLLARDHFGIKPLYIAESSTAIVAASEVKALLEMPGIDVSADAAGRVGFFIWGHVPEPFTLYRGIRALPAGSTLWINRDGAKSLHSYASVTQLFLDAEAEDDVISREELSSELQAALLESVRYHLVSDVEVGVFLSSGLDSTTLTALASEAQGRLRTVTLGFEEYKGTPNDETPLAEAVARQYGTSHTTLWITRADFQRELERLVTRMDQPTIDGINSYFIAKAAADCGLKVAISGLGGDELFGGYPSFRQLPRLVSTVGRIPGSRMLGRVVRQLWRPLLGKVTSPKYAGLLEYGGDFGGAYLLRRGLFMPWELDGFLDSSTVRGALGELGLLDALHRTTESVVTPRFRVSALEAGWYMRNQLLRDTDWASMSHSLEVRVPLVDWQLWRRVARLARAMPNLGKAHMAATPRLPLPTEVLARPKTGFQVPTREWMTGRPTIANARGLRGWAHYVSEVVA